MIGIISSMKGRKNGQTKLDRDALRNWKNMEFCTLTHFQARTLVLGIVMWFKCTGNCIPDFHIVGEGFVCQK